MSKTSLADGGKTWAALDVGPLQHPERLQTALADFKVTAIDESSQANAWRIFFKGAHDRNSAAQALLFLFPEMSIRVVDVPDEDWVTRSQQHLRAIRIGRIIVAPPWDVPSTSAEPATVSSSRTPPAPPIVIVIEPSTGFGTGHHATTRLCLLALQQIEVQGRRVIDVGTGSGLLAIAAGRLGAAHALGVDDDTAALEAAKKNVALNQGADVTLRMDDVRSMSLEPFDIVIANLTGALLRQAASGLLRLAAPGASLILSGFMADEEHDVLSAYPDTIVRTRTSEEEWVCVTLQRA